MLYSLISAAVCCTSLVESFRDSYSFCILAASALVLSSSSADFSGSRGKNSSVYACGVPTKQVFIQKRLNNEITFCLFVC